MTRGGRRHNFEFVLLLCDQRVSRPRVQNMVMKSNPRVLFVGHDSADATLLELVLVRDLPSAEVVHIGDPVALGREIERSSFDLVVCDEGLDWMDSNLVLLEVRIRRPTSPVVILVAKGRDARLGVGRNHLATTLEKSSASFLELPGILRAALERAAARQSRPPREPRIRDILARSRIGVFRSTLDGQLLDADEAFLDILGARSLEEARQHDLSDLTPRLLRGFTETGKIYRRRQSLAGVDGRLIQVAFTELVNLDDQGMSVLDGLLEEIKEQEALRPEEREETPKPATSRQDLRLFSSLVAHELREPLRTIEQSTGMLLEDSKGKLGKTAEESADLVVGGVRRLQSLIEGLLTLGRFGGEQRVESVDCNDLVKDVLEILRLPIEESQATVTVNPLPTVRADPDQLRLLFRNLLSNAVKFHGENPPSIDVAARQAGEDWTFSVEDGGIGIEPGSAEKVFEHFARSGDAAGSGLGLAICREVVEKHGGRIWVESEPGRGAIFYFTLPLLADRRESGEEPDGSVERGAPSSPARKETG